MLKDTGATGLGKLGAANIDKVTLTDNAFDPNATDEMLNAGMYGANEDKTDDIGTDIRRARSASWAGRTRSFTPTGATLQAASTPASRRRR